MKKRISAAWVLTLSMLCTVALPAQAANYGDTEEHYAREAIETWSGYGVLEGYPDGSFRPDATVTRAELAAVLDRIMGYQNEVENTFTDLPEEQWYTQYILHLAAEDIFKGNPDGTMKPDEPITRQEVFAALSRAFALEESDEPTGFSDDATIAAWARGYLSTMKQAGYIQGDQNGNIYADEPISRGEVVTVLNKMVKGLVNSDGTYSRDCQGNLVVNARDVTLKDMTVTGNLIVADGVADGDVYLDGVTVEGDVVLRGCGENSFHILPGCNVKNIIVTKTTRGAIRLVNESGQPIPMVWVNDGSSGVVLDGDELGNVVIACDAPVTIASKKVQTVSVTGNAKVTVEKGTTISKVDLAKTAENATLTVEGRVTAMANDAGIKVDKTNGGTVGGSSSGGGSSGGSSSGGGNSGGGSSGGDTPAAPTTISEASLMILAPVFGGRPDPADALGVGFTSRTEWFNVDGSDATYRWKASADDGDTFTADQAYQAVVTLSPISGYAFGDTLKVTVTDGETPATEYTPASSVKSGDDWVVTLKYEKTEVKEYVEGVYVSGPSALLVGETGTMNAGYTDNYLVDPSSHSYKWYQCSDADKTSPTEVASTREYTIPTSAADGKQDGDKLYYYVEVTAGGKTYTSGVTEIELQKPLTADDVPTPVVEEAHLMLEDGELVFNIRCSGVLQHKNLEYRFEPIMVNGNGEGHPTFSMWAGADYMAGCHAWWDTDEQGNLILAVDADMMNASSWRGMFESITQEINDRKQYEEQYVAPGVVRIEYPQALVRIIPVLNTENEQTVLDDKVAVGNFDGSWAINYVVGTREELSGTGENQPLVEGRYPSSNFNESTVIRNAVTGYPKDGVRLVVDDLANGSAHLEAKQGDGSYSWQVVDFEEGVDASYRHSVQCYFETVYGGWFDLTGAWDWENKGWTLTFWEYLQEWMVSEETEKQPPELYFCYRGDDAALSQEGQEPQEIYLYRVIPDIVFNSGNE